jgi:hypothetical protein
MNKKLITAILGVGMGLASVSAFADTYERCSYVYDHCMSSGADSILCEARYELCMVGIWY